jgi:hypothetical protein
MAGARSVLAALGAAGRSASAAARGLLLISYRGPTVSDPSARASPALNRV